MKLLASVLLLTAFFINENLASLKCYTCPSGDDVCDAKKSNFTTKTCEDTTMSNVTDAKVKCFKSEKAGKIKRGCATDKGNKTYCAEEMKKDNTTKCFECERELCNAAIEFCGMEKFHVGLIALGSVVVMRNLL